MCEVLDQQQTKIAVLSGVYENGGLVFYDTVESHHGIHSVKPILYPLSCLTKEITVDGYNEGKPFVPMVELYEKYETGFFRKGEKLGIPIPGKGISCTHEIYELIEQELFILKYHVPTSNMGDLVYSFSYDPNLNRFSMRNETHKSPLGIAYQLDMFQLLFSWHINLFNLPESEYIDKSKI